MFDLDFEDKQKVKEYTKFRKTLIKEGFEMMQFSIYIKYFCNVQELETYKNRIKKELPSFGQIRFLSVTENQMEKMDIINNRKNDVEESRIVNNSKQLLLF
jgi:CRISPR-associated protein Cas2